MGFFFFIIFQMEQTFPHLFQEMIMKISLHVYRAAKGDITPPSFSSLKLRSILQTIHGEWVTCRWVINGFPLTSSLVFLNV